MHTLAGARTLLQPGYGGGGGYLGGGGAGSAAASAAAAGGSAAAAASTSGRRLSHFHHPHFFGALPASVPPPNTYQRTDTLIPARSTQSSGCPDVIQYSEFILFYFILLN